MEKKVELVLLKYSQLSPCGHLVITDIPITETETRNHQQK